MPQTAVPSTFDVVIWLMDRALNDGEYLQPAKLHRLLYLSQAYFAVAYAGTKLMPATFVAEENGPVEPDVWRVYASGRPYIESVPPAERVEHFLDSIWRRFGSHSADYLGNLVSAQPPFLEAFAQGPRSEITLSAMVKFYGRPRSPSVRGGSVPGVQDVLRPRTMVSASGQAVSVRRWNPRGGKSDS
ncbi:MAG: hypothetical protein JXQ84_02735 [Rhodospirillaceae bacterium]|nr:hypothetical protein [Rhodospirillaceae bacterium]